MSRAVRMRDDIVNITEKTKLNVGWMPLSTDPVSEKDVRNNFPTDRFNVFVNRVEFNPPVTNENLKKMGPRLEKAASLVAPDEPLDVLVYACTACATNLGNETVCANINLGRPGVPVINPALAGTTAMEAIGAKRMGLVAPYNAEVSDSVGDHFRSAGIDVIKTVCMDAPRDYEISRISDETMINACVEVAEEDIDAIFMTCAAFPAINVIEEVERRTGKIVITSNQAMIWMAYRSMGLNDNLTNLGRLFEYEMKGVTNEESVEKSEEVVA